MMSRLASLYRLGLVLATALAMAACSANAPSPPPTTAAPAGAVDAATNAASANPMPAPAVPATAHVPGPIVPPAGPAPVAGTDYVEIAGGTPFQPGTGKIEVVEVFGYTCPHCAIFEPLVSAWAARLPADVRFVPLAAPFGGYWTTYARAFYTAQQMGIAEQSHEAMFRAIHIDHSLPVQPLPTDAQLAGFYARFGADPQQFISTLSSFPIDAKASQATQFIQRSFVGDTPSTPTLIIDGQYRVTGTSHEETLRIADHLIAMQRAAMTATTDSPAGAAP